MIETDFDDPEDIEKDWLELIHGWSRKNTQLRKSHELSDNERRKIQREWWAISAEVLFFLVRAENAQKAGVDPKPLALISELARMSDDLSRGIVAPILKEVATSGRTSFSLRERQTIAIALYYLDAVVEKRIRDRSPIKTVKSAFKVKHQTVRDWKTRKNEICSGMPGADYAPERLQKELKCAGKVHRSISRSHHAIEKRSKND